MVIPSFVPLEQRSSVTDARPVITGDWRVVGRWEWAGAATGEWAVLTTFAATADPGTTGQVRFRVAETGTATDPYEVGGPTGSRRNNWISIPMGGATLVVEARRVGGAGGVRILEAAATAAPAEFAYTAPDIVQPPSILGDPTPGATLTVDPPVVVAYPPASLSYQWYRDGAAVAGATGSTFTVPAGWGGSAVVVWVTASNVVGFDSEPSDAVFIEEATSAGFGTSFGTTYGSS